MGAVRMFLALVVVTFHVSAKFLVPNNIVPASPNFTLGFHSAYAVLFFYIISGFLITFTLSKNYSHKADGTAAFYQNRAIRIFSLYWPVLVVAMIAFPDSINIFFAGTLLDKFTNIFLLGADWNLNFGTYPDTNWHAAPAGMWPAWTLGAEITFYLVAPYLVRRWRLVAVLFGASLTLRGMLVYEFGTKIAEHWTYYFAPATFSFFLAGQGICLLAEQKANWLKNHWLGCSLMAMSFFTMFITDDTGFDISRLWISVAFFAVGLPGFFSATKDIHWMNVLGSFSYPIYLTHTLVLILVGPALYSELGRYGIADQAHVIPMVITFLAASTLAGVFAHYFIEKPVAFAMKAALSRSIPFLGGDQLKRGQPRAP